MPKAIQFNITCDDCRTYFYVHVKEEDLPDEPVINIICPECGKSWCTQINQNSILEVCYAG